MKKYQIILGFVALISSCSPSENIPSDSLFEDGIVCNVPPVEEINLSDSVTRSNLTYDENSGMIFSWEPSEKITVFSDENNQGDFSLSYIHTNSSSATFTGGNFHLIKGQQYYALSKSVKASTFYPTNGLNTDLWTNISISYDGQRMVESGSTAHLGKCDYMAGRATAEAENVAGFDFIHLGATLRVTLKNVPTNIKFKRLEIYDATDDSYRELTRTLNITNNADATDATYEPYLNEPTLTKSSERIGVDLGPVDGSGLSANSDKTLVVFMEVPPFDFAAKSHTIGFRLIPVSDSQVSYFGTFKSKKIRNDKAYRMDVEVSPADRFYVTVNIHHQWEKGNSVTQTRATGDPGVTEEMTPPSHLYAFFVNNGHLQDYRDIAAEWTTSNNVSTLKSTLEFSSSSANEARVYFIASDKAISTWYKSNGTEVSVTNKGVNGTEEADIRDIVYNYSDYDGGTGDGQMENLYSTPWSATSFVGALSTGDAIKDVHLYHVASKVDINWKNSSSTALSGSVYVSNFPTEKLSYFKPTTGNTTASTTSKTTEKSITTGSAYTGRAVFYVPQPSDAKYNVTIGGTPQDIQFTPDDVYTSWFLGQIKIK